MTGFVHRVGLLGVATAVGQVGVALNLAIVARLLTQTDVGHYTVFVSYAMMLLPVSLLSYDVLLPNVKDEEVPTLIHGVALLALAVPVLVALVFATLGYSHFMPLAVLLIFMATIRIVEFAGIRAQRVETIALARTLPHVGFMALLAGLAFSAAPTLETVLWFQVIAFAVPAIGLAWRELAGALRRRPGWSGTFTFLRRRWRNPFVLAPSEIASAAAWNLPVVLVARSFGEAMAGQFGVMLRYTMAPVGLMNSVVGNVYHAELARGVRARDPDLPTRFAFVNRRMLLIGLATGAATALALPPLLRLLLGPGWETAERLVLLMAPLVAVAVWISPFGVAFYVFERSLELLLLNLVFIAIVVAAFSMITADLRLAVGSFVALVVARFLFMLVRVKKMIRGVGSA